MSTVPARKRQRAEQVVPTFGSPSLGESSTPRIGEDPVPVTETADYPIPNFKVLYNKMRDPQTGVGLEDRRYRLLTYAQCFIGSELVDWLIKNMEENTDRTLAVEMGQKLLDAGIIYHVARSEPFLDGHFFYRFQEDEQTSVLNMKRVWDSNRRARYAIDVSVDMITKLACLCEEHRRNILESQLSGTGEYGADNVDYASLAKSEAFRQYVLGAAELQAVEISSLDTEEKLAFFVNIYNALCLHGHVVYGAPTNFLKRMSFFRGMAYRVGGLDYTLDDIEHGILRGNKRPPSIRFMQQFRTSDPKCQLLLSRREERIHFVISAGTPSDPPIRILEMENLIDELSDATEEFLNRTVQVDTAKKEVTLPRIFSWYSDDFPKPESNCLRWVAGYLKKEPSATLLDMVNDPNGPPTIVYQNFDWTNSEARFNAAVIRRKRRRLERERAIANGEKDGIVSPNLLASSPHFSTFGPSPSGLGSPNIGGGIFGNAQSPGIGQSRTDPNAVARTPPLQSSQRPKSETPALSGASAHDFDASTKTNQAASHFQSTDDSG